MLFNKCERSNRMLIEDSNKDNRTKLSNLIANVLTNYTYNDSLLIAENPQVHCASESVAMNTACLASIHSPDDVFMAR